MLFLALLVFWNVSARFQPLELADVQVSGVTHADVNCSVLATYFVGSDSLVNFVGIFGLAALLFLRLFEDQRVLAQDLVNLSSSLGEVKLESHGREVHWRRYLFKVRGRKVVDYVRTDLDLGAVVVCGERDRPLERVLVQLCVVSALKYVHHERLNYDHVSVIVERVALEDKHWLALRHRLFRRNVLQPDVVVQLELELLGELVVEQTPEDDVVWSLLSMRDVDKER